jgi:hypothetical protein
MGCVCYEDDPGDTPLAKQLCGFDGVLVRVPRPILGYNILIADAVPDHEFSHEVCSRGSRFFRTYFSTAYHDGARLALVIEPRSMDTAAHCAVP